MTTEDRERTRAVLPLAVRRGKRVYPYSAGLTVKAADELHVLVHGSRREAANGWLASEGWAAPGATV